MIYHKLFLLIEINFKNVAQASYRTNANIDQAIKIDLLIEINPNKFVIMLLND